MTLATSAYLFRDEAVAPYFSLARAEWVPYVYAWDDETGEFHRAEGPRGFGTYREAVEASRFLGIDLLLVR